MIPILILAAGQSTRMRGADKLLEDVGGMALLRRQVRMAVATGSPVFVALAPGQTKREAVIADLDVTVLYVPEAVDGLSGTMRGAVAVLGPASAFMIVLADLVALETGDLMTVLAAQKAHPAYLIWRGATEDGKAGHPIIFDDSLRPLFAELEGDEGGDRIVQPLRDQTMLVALPGQRARLDLDTPEEWAAWRSAISGK